MVQPTCVVCDKPLTGKQTRACSWKCVRRLANAGQYVDLDAGYARWRTTGEMAHRLLRAGIQYVQGFSVNVANRQTTRQSYWWGGSSRTSSAGAEFVIDTSRNGLGPPPDE